MLLQNLCILIWEIKTILRGGHDTCVTANYGVHVKYKNKLRCVYEKIES